MNTLAVAMLIMMAGLALSLVFMTRALARERRMHRDRLRGYEQVLHQGDKTLVRRLGELVEKDQTIDTLKHDLWTVKQYVETLVIKHGLGGGHND